MKIIALFIYTFFIALNGFAASEYKVNNINMLSINSSINPATFHYLKSNLKKMSHTKGDIVILKLNTPGGLVSTTKDILSLIGDSDIPIAVWITPEGASATSAGAIISSGAHFLFMSPGTNIGAATPITMKGDIKKSDGKDKAVNDLTALVSALAKSRGRNPDKFKEMISKASSFDSQDALKFKIINQIIKSQKELIKYLDKKEIQIKDKKLKLSFDTAYSTKEIEMSVSHKLLNIFAHPTTAYLLFVIGAALLYFELQAPGGFIAGSLGIFSLLLAAIGFQVLPLNFGALGLILLSFMLFVLEAYITSYGILTLAGLGAMIFGSLFLFDTPNSYIALNTKIIFSSSAAIALYVMGVAYLFFKKTKEITYFHEENKHGTVLKILDLDNNEYQVKIGAEIWNAHSTEKLNIGDKIIVTKAHSLKLEVHKYQEENI